MDLSYVGQYSSGGSYFLTLALKNTGSTPITQILVNINAQQIPLTFKYLDKAVNSETPLPAYQTATGYQDVTPPINNAGTYPLIIQALASNGTVYSYQTTISS